jgi:FdhE protein
MAAVAGRFVDRLLGRGPEASEVAEARRDLDRLAAERPSLAGPARFLRAVLPHLLPESGINNSEIAEPAARARLETGVPLLRGARPSLDPRRLAQRWRSLCGALAGQGNADAERLDRAIRKSQLDLGRLVEEVLTSGARGVHAQAEALGLDASLTTTLLRLMLFPSLAGAAADLAGFWKGVGWHRRFCLVCGSWPLLAELRGLDQTRILRCGLCAAEWECARMLCPFCGCRDHERLGYFHTEGEESRYRVAFCEQCRGYVKTAFTLLALSPLQLLVTDAATLHLDLAAAHRGYTQHLWEPEA